MPLTLSEQRSELAPLKWFPWVCSNSMPDDRLIGLNVVAGAHGFGVGPSKIHFEDFSALPDTDYLALVPAYYVIRPEFDCSDHELFLRALNYQDESVVEESKLGSTGDLFEATSKYVPPIAARLAACLHVLTKSPRLADDFFQPGATVIAQRNLSALLVKYPVLMHPAGLYISARSFCVEKVSSLTSSVQSIPNVIALASYARFPMAKDGLSNEVLTAFANNRCTKLGLTNRSGRVFGFEQKKKFAKKTVFSLSVFNNKAKPEMIASLHGLSKLTKVPKSRGSDPSHPFSYLTDTTAYGSYNADFGDVYAESFVAACGVGSSQVSGTWRDRHNPSPEFLAVLRELRELSVSGNNRVKSALEAITLNLILGTKPHAYPPQRVTQGVHQIAAGLVDAGIVKDISAAGAWLAARLHYQASVPETNIECATSFIRALDSYSVTVTSDSLSPPLMGTADDPPGVVSVPDFGYTDLLRAVWREAIRIHTIEKSMKEVIDRSQTIKSVNDEEFLGRRRMKV